MKIVCECGLSHDGSLGYCYGIIAALAHSGIWGVKFQCHDDDKCNQFRCETFFPQDATREHQWRRTAFTRGQWQRLAEFVRHNGLAFGVSVFSEQAAKMLEGAVDFWKVGSGQTSAHNLLSRLRGTAPVVLSTGMSDWREIDAAVELLDRESLTILQCMTKYPTQPADVGLNVMLELRQRYGCKAGLSDHSGALWPGIVAASMGADMLEVHVCWDRRQWGPDTSSSLTVGDVWQLADGIKFIEAMTPVDKSQLSWGQLEHKRTFSQCAESASA